MKKLQDKVLDSNYPVIFYELLPPTHDKLENIDAYVECAIDLLTSTPIMIDAVNIPDIREETPNASIGTQKHVPTIEPATFAQMLKGVSYNHIDIVLNHCTVYETWKTQKQWFNSTIMQPNFGSLILVGGSSSSIQYPGPTVLEMADWIRSSYPEQILYGGITIQTRRYHAPEKDEPVRIYTKGLHGFEFFTSQIIYEPVSIKFLLRDYAQICREKGCSPKRIFLSFAPVSTKKDLDFLRWLGVSIPKTIEHELFKANIGIGWRSTKIAENILSDILNFMREEQINVPIALNIEHITRHNFELSLSFIEKLGRLYHNFINRHL